jgi:Fe-Mn family superoxide dismutase
MDQPTAYQARTFNLSGLNGISDQTLELHFKLYEGYVKETNRLNEQISTMLQEGQIGQEIMRSFRIEAPAWL